MITRRLSRTDREALYIEKATALHLRCEYSISGDWDFVQRFSDEELQAGIEATMGQIRLEKCRMGFHKISRAAMAASIPVAIAWLAHLVLRQIL